MAHKELLRSPSCSSTTLAKLVPTRKGAARDAGASAELGPSRRPLVRPETCPVATWDHMSKRGVTADVDGETVSFL